MFFHRKAFAGSNWVNITYWLRVTCFKNPLFQPALLSGIFCDTFTFSTKWTEIYRTKFDVTNHLWIHLSHRILLIRNVWMKSEIMLICKYNRNNIERRPIYKFMRKVTHWLIYQHRSIGLIGLQFVLKISIYIQ